MENGLFCNERSLSKYNIQKDHAAKVETVENIGTIKKKTHALQEGDPGNV